jgi:hypothetical protein
MCFLFALCAPFLRLTLARKAAGPPTINFINHEVTPGERVLAKSSKTGMVNKSFTTKG